MDPMVGSSVVSDGDISDSSDNAALLDFCFLCSRQFFHINLDNYGTERLKAEDVLETFFDELGPVDRALLQCCPSCQALCKTLTRTKEALSSLIDEITSLLLRSRKVSYLLSKSRVVSRLFQSSNLSLPPCEVSSSYLQQPLSQINFSKAISSNNSNSCFPTQFNLRLDSSNMSDENQLDLTISHSNISNSAKKPSSSFKAQDKSDSQQETSVTCGSAFASIYNDSLMNSVSDNACDISEAKQLPQQAFKIIDMDLKKGSSDKNYKKTPDLASNIQTPPNHNVIVNNETDRAIDTNKRKIEDLGTVDCRKRERCSPISLKRKANCSNEENSPASSTATEKATKFKCDLCNKSFQNGRNLRFHMGAHNQERKFICEMCGASYRHKVGLDNHVAIHKGESKFQCDVCHKSFSQRIGLQRHLRIHTRKFQFVCDTCGKQFLHHTSFIAHKFIHTGTKDFSCPNCELTFSQKSNLQRHLKSHSGEKPHSCSICSRTFSERYNLLAHLKSHEEGSTKVHKCSVCLKTYTRKFKLKQHMKHIHNFVI